MLGFGGAIVNTVQPTLYYWKIIISQRYLFYSFHIRLENNNNCYSYISHILLEDETGDNPVHLEQHAMI